MAIPGTVARLPSQASCHPVTGLGGHPMAMGTFPAGCTNSPLLPWRLGGLFQVRLGTIRSSRTGLSVGTGRESWREAFFHLPTPSSLRVCQAWLPFESFSLCQAREKGRGGNKEKKGKKKKTHRNVSRDLASFRLLSPEYPEREPGSRREGGFGRPRDGGRGKTNRAAAFGPWLLPQRPTKGSLGGGHGRVPPPPWGWPGGDAGSGHPESHGGGSEGKASAAFHPAVGMWCADGRPGVGPVSWYGGGRAARGEGTRLFSGALGR